MPKQSSDPFSCFYVESKGRWRAVAVVRDQFGRKDTKPIERKTEEAARKAMRDFLRETMRLIPSDEMTVEAMMDAFLVRCRAKKRAPKTIHDYDHWSESLIKPTLGHMLVRDLRPSHVEAMMEVASPPEEEERKGAPSANKARSVLRAAINKVARKADPKLPNVAELADAIPQKSADSFPLSLAEALMVVRAEPDPLLATLWLTLATTGRRPYCEIGRLTWPELTERKDGMWLTLVESKTPEGKKPVPVPKATAEALRSLPRTQVLVFPSPRTGKPYSETFIRDAWRAACKRAEVRECTVYSLRHTFGTEKARKEKDHVVKRLMGLTDIRTAIQYYVEHDAEALREAVD